MSCFADAGKSLGSDHPLRRTLSLTTPGSTDTTGEQEFGEKINGSEKIVCGSSYSHEIIFLITGLWGRAVEKLKEFRGLTVVQ